ncbi:hypothetical protein VNO77_27337 [Canavalia gladiata]|uniref:Uncharacterized protein n=1 Tax=Canavalia gladiata TaxID=3824 RepID=A0AAN9Q6E1_CANGL
MVTTWTVLWKILRRYFLSSSFEESIIFNTAVLLHANELSLRLISDLILLGVQDLPFTEWSTHDELPIDDPVVFMSSSMFPLAASWLTTPLSSSGGDIYCRNANSLYGIRTGFSITDAMFGIWTSGSYTLARTKSLYAARYYANFRQRWTSVGA